MDEQTSNQTENNSNDSIHPVATTEYIDESTNETPNANAKTQDSCDKNKEPINLVVNIPQENKWYRHSEIVAIWAGVFVQIILALFTYLLFLKTGHANSISAEAVRQATIANNISQENQTRSIVQQESSAKTQIIKDSMLKIKDSLTTDLAKKSLGTQINSVQETQKEFVAANQPFLQLIEPSIVTLKVNEILQIDYILTEVTNIPIKVVSQKSSAIIKIDQPTLAEVMSHFSQESELNGYLTKETSMGGRITLPKRLTNIEVSGVTDGNYYVYVCREITYKNLVTGKLRKYLFFLKLKPIKSSKIFTNGTFVQFLYNENS